VFVSKTGTLELDRSVFSREVIFNAISICLLWYVLHDVAPIDGHDEEHLFISFVDACLMVSGYVMYIVICVNYDAIVNLFSCTPAGSDCAVARLRIMVRSPTIDQVLSTPFRSLLSDLFDNTLKNQRRQHTGA
jgi:hypothetical protein